jgi:hypothetical protein
MPTPPSSTGDVYGAAINTDTLAESAIGGSSAQSVAVRFRAEQSSALNSIRVYDMGTQSGYGAGTGGAIRVTVQTNGGSDRPSGTALATLTYVPADAPGRLLTFGSPATLTAGTIYHVVFENIDANPGSNWSSIDNLYVYNQTYSPIQPKWADSLFTLLNKRGTGAWSVYSRYTPIIDIAYANGQHQGQGYMEVNVYDPGWHAISGTSKVRESFTVSGGNRTVTSAHVRLRRTSGSDSLSIRLETGSGVEIETKTVAASLIAQSNPGGDNGGAVWADVTFDSPHVLANGQSYNLVLSTAASTTYTTYGIRKGNDYGYSSQTYYNEGRAQYTTGGSWSEWKNGDDIQFYLDVQ